LNTISVLRRSHDLNTIVTTKKSLYHAVACRTPANLYVNPPSQIYRFEDGLLNQLTNKGSQTPITHNTAHTHTDIQTKHTHLHTDTRPRTKDVQARTDNLEIRNILGAALRDTHNPDPPSPLSLLIQAAYDDTTKRRGASNFPHTSMTPQLSPVRSSTPPHRPQGLHRHLKEMVRQRKGKPIISTNKQVHNLSSKILNPHHISLLGKGLTFCPTPHKQRATETQSAELAQEPTSLHSRILYKYIFRFKPPIRDRVYQKRPGKKARLTGSDYINNLASDSTTALRNLFQDADLRTNTRDNLSRGERAALKDLRTDMSITIKPADKGSGVVIMDTNHYTTGCLKLLNNTKYYRPINGSLSRENANIIKRLLNYWRDYRFINKREHASMIPPTTPRIRLFYALPKIHKERATWDDDRQPPLRPIVSDSGSESSFLSVFISNILQPVATIHPSYLKDTWDLLKHLQTTRCPPDCLLVTMDVVGLFTNIDHKKCMTLAAAALDRRRSRKPPTEETMEAIKVILTRNDFTFGDRTYLQVLGIAMGCPFSPYLADIFVAEHERLLNNHILQTGITKPLYCQVCGLLYRGPI